MNGIARSKSSPYAERGANVPSRPYAAYKPVAPYFDLARGALGDLVDGAHFFDVVEDDIVYEVGGSAVPHCDNPDLVKAPAAGPRATCPMC